MSFVPPDFGGFLAVWDPRDPHALVVRYGKGKPVEGLTLTPLNLLQLRGQLDLLIEQGVKAGYITDKHYSQSEQLPPLSGTVDEVIEKLPPRAHVDRIAGTD